MFRSVVLLRHATAGNRSDWTADDTHRPLDANGLTQAARLVTLLDGERFDQIWTSPLVRCQHTVGPLAANRRTPVISTPWLSPDTDPTSVEHGLATLTGRVLLCTHGECVAPVLKILTGGREAVSDLNKGDAISLRWNKDGILRSIRRITQP